jgi:probable F420-dependent oxidoreductase
MTSGHEQLRERLGPLGARSGAAVRRPSAEVQAFAAELERLGAGAFWFPESYDVFAQASLLLAATSELMICSSIASIYARDATAAAGGAAVLAEAYGERFVLGLGVSHPPLVQRRGHTYAGPVSAMRAYLDGLDRAQDPTLPAAPRLLGALGPKMLRLAAERTAGAHPYCVPVEHTPFARDALGPDALLCVEQSFVLTGDRAVALDASRRYIDVHVGFDNYRNNLLRLGYAPDALDADSLLETLVVWGDEDAVLERAVAHLDAGADHVCVQALPTGETGVDQLQAVFETARRHQRFSGAAVAPVRT